MKVIIAGAGIGGLSAAIGLRRAGHDVTVFERSSLLRETGAAVSVCPNASPALLEWGFDVKRARMRIARRHLLALGDTLEVKEALEYPDFAQLYHGPWFLAHRVDLHSELRRLATEPSGPGQPVQLVLRSEVVTYDSAEGSIVLADKSVYHADLVVAADGVHSSAVSQAIGRATPAVPTGLAVFRFLIPTDELWQDPEIAPLLMEGFTKEEDGLMRTLCTDGSIRRLIWYPCANNAIQNFAVVHQVDRTDGNEGNWNRSADLEDLLSHLEDYHPSILRIIRKATTIKWWPLLYRDPIPTLTKGRLVLIGDAGHPMLPNQGQGAGQAIEDAAALSVIFTDLPANPSKDEILNRLKLFDDIRIRRVSALQILSNASQDQAWKIKERAQEFMPEGVTVPATPAEFWAHNYGYDVLADCRRRMKEYLAGKKG